MVEYEIYRSLQNPDHYVAVRIDDASENAEGVRASQNLVPFTRVIDDTLPKLAFNPEAAERAIAAHGFYAFAILVEERDGFQMMGL